MGKDDAIDREPTPEGEEEYRVKAADKKAAKKKAGKKAAKKVAKKKAAAKKKSKTAKKSAEPTTAAQAPAPEARPQPAYTPPSQEFGEEPRSGGTMRGIVALWGPLAIIVILIVVSRIGDEEPAAPGAVSGLSSSLEGVEGAAKGVAADVRDALTGGDPHAAAALGAQVPGAGRSGNTGEDLAAAFKDSGVSHETPQTKSATTAADPWAESQQVTAPASVSAPPDAAIPQPDNPWAPVDTPMMGGAMPMPQHGQGEGMPMPQHGQGAGMPMPQHGQGGGMPMAPYGQDQGYGYGPGPGYGQGYGRGYGQGYGAYGGEQPYPPPAYYPPQGYAPPPGYPQQQQAYGAPGYGPPPGYGGQPAYPYPPPYPPGYYPPAQ